MMRKKVWNSIDFQSPIGWASFIGYLKEYKLSKTANKVFNFISKSSFN